MCSHLGPVLPIFVQMNIRLAEGDDTWREVARYILTLIRAARAENKNTWKSEDLKLSGLEMDNVNNISFNILFNNYPFKIVMYPLGKNFNKTWNWFWKPEAAKMTKNKKYFDCLIYATSLSRFKKHNVRIM